MAARWLTASLEVRNILGTDHREIRILKRQIPRRLCKYIATREGVEKLDESLRDRPVTQSQQEFINKLLEDFPDSKELWEYEDYQNRPPSAPLRSLSPQLSNSTWGTFG